MRIIDTCLFFFVFFFFFQAEDGIRDVERSRGLGDVYKRQVSTQSTWEIAPNHDYVVLGSDGIFDKLSNKDVIQCVLNTIKEPLLAKSVHHECGLAVECIIKNSLLRKSFDNVTILMVAFKNFKTTYKHCLQLKESRMRDQGTKSKPSGSRAGALLDPKFSLSRNKGIRGQKALTEDKIGKDIFNRSIPYSKPIQCLSLIHI
eukprot:TRINITY_DN14204_c0_g1_i2.p1 TRINITY_DN14204_c0_g1~~TRINITY_DN14204_c0_g1_i2.p1  ORF type:complete len:202 (-),score=36.05 TRINITY_DN14204_c0_g1_i2:143-748(-)